MKKIFALVLACLFVLVSGCAEGEDLPVVYFDCTEQEIVDALSEDHFITLEQISNIDNTKTGDKIAAFSFYSEPGNYDTYMHYQIGYSAETGNASTINFFFDKNFMGNIDHAWTRFNYHIGAISTILDPTINTVELYEIIDSGIDENGHSMYIGDTFALFATLNDKYFDAAFYPAERYAKYNQ